MSLKQQNKITNYFNAKNNIPEILEYSGRKEGEEIQEEKIEDFVSDDSSSSSNSNSLNLGNRLYRSYPEIDYSGLKNQGQKDAITDIVKFLYSNQKYHLLNGSAGTGKTHIMGVIIQYRDFEFILATPTHKASKVLEGKVGERVRTIDQILFYKMKYNKEGVLKRVKEKKTDYQLLTLNEEGWITIGHKEDENGILNNDKEFILLLDESSMINKHMFKDLIKLQNRILFIGDSYQLPPINEKISKVFDKVKNVSTLTKIIRTGSNDKLANMHKLFRECVDNKKSLRKISKHLITEFDFKSKVKECIKSDDTFIIVTYTNKSVDRWNKFCVNELRKLHNTDYKYIPGMIMILNRTIRYEDEFLHTSDTFKITNVTKLEIKPSEVGGEYFNMKRSVTIYRLECESLENGKTYEFNKILDEDREYFMGKVNDKRKIVKGWIEKSNDNDIQELWAEFWGRFNIYEVNLSIYFSITTHKSQGSTIPIVFVDLNDIFNPYYKTSSIDRRKLSYVAVSRSSERVYLLGNN